jgi:hypothetical protein
MWTNIIQKGPRQDREQSKKSALLAFVMDPELKDTFWEMTFSLTVSRKVKSTDDTQLVDKVLEDGNFQTLALDFDGTKPFKASSAQCSQGKDKDQGKDNDKGKDKDQDKDKGQATEDLAKSKVKGTLALVRSSEA